MKRLLCSVFILLMGVLSGRENVDKHQIFIKCNKKSHRYSIGEKINFEITSNRCKKALAIITLDGGKVLQRQEISLPATLSVTHNEPGFVRCMVSSKKITSYCGVAVEPEKLKPYIPKPADFDEFWDNALKKFRELPVDLKVTSRPSFEGYDIYLLDCANVNGKRAYAMLSIPQKREGKVPLLVKFGGGEAILTERGFCNQAVQTGKILKRPSATLYFHLPPYPPVKDPKDKNKKHKKFLKEIGGLKRYIFIGMDTRETCYGYSAIAGCLRLLNAAAERPEIDKNNIIYIGASHGGSFGIYLAACSNLIKAAFCGVPSFCDYAAFTGGRKSAEAKDSTKYWKNFMYFDCAYFADRIKIPIFCTAGFIDLSCPPSGIYAMYNQIKSPKKMYDKIQHGHADVPQGYYSEVNKWLRSHLTQ